MEKIVNTQTNIFNENKSNNKIAKITFMLCSLLCFANIQSSLAQNSNKLIVPVKCSGNSNQKYDECINYCDNNFKVFQSQDAVSCSSVTGDSNTGGMCGNNVWTYITHNPLSVSFKEMEVKGPHQNSGGNSSELKNGVILSCKASCEFFKNQCSSYTVEIDTVKFLEAMPEIGISRVDPNLIEF